MTKNKILRICFSGLVAFVCSLIFTGCFHNDGDIGVYFGSWVIEKIEIDGNPDTNYKGHTMISFQSSLFDLTDVDGQGGIMGLWSEKGAELTLRGAEETATRKDADGNPIFPLTTGFGSGTDNDLTIHLEIIKKTKKEMIWQRTDDEGRVWRYVLRHLL